MTRQSVPQSRCIGRKGSVTKSNTPSPWLDKSSTIRARWSELPTSSYLKHICECVKCVIIKCVSSCFTCLSSMTPFFYQMTPSLAGFFTPMTLLLLHLVRNGLVFTRVVYWMTPYFGEYTFYLIGPYFWLGVGTYLSLQIGSAPPPRIFASLRNINISVLHRYG